MKKVFTLLIALLLAITGSWAQTSDYFNGFETTGVAGDWGTTSIQASGFNGIPASAGSFYGVTGQGDFTRFGGYNSVFPALGYKTTLDIYLNVNGGYANDKRFDYSSAINGTDGAHERDFVFSGGFYNDATGPGVPGTNRFIFNASNNTPGWPKDASRNPIAIGTSGWYTFEHYFYNNGSGVLAVDLKIYNSADVLMGSWTLSDPADIIGSTVGGNRYGWMVTNQLGTLAIDNSSLTVINPTPITNIGTSSSSACGILDVQVTVQDFKSVGAISAVLNFDPTKLQLLPIEMPPFQGVTVNSEIALPFVSGDNTIGQFRFSSTPDPAITLADDDDVLFTLHFNVLPAAVGGTTTPLTWSKVYQECEYAGPGGTPTYVSTFNDGEVTIPVRPVVNTTLGLAYCTIQEAITAATPGNTITVAAGTYAEDIIVNKAITLLGPNAEVNACSGTRDPEAIIVPKTNAPSSGEIIHVAASNVTIKGFTIDGDNPSLPANGYGFGGADMHAAEGVTVYETGVNSLNVSNNIFQNLTYYGVTLYDYPAGVPSSGHVISNNKFQNLGTYDAGSGIANWGGGVLLYNNQYTAVTNNCMANVRIGIQTGNFWKANPGDAAYQVISGNTIEARRRGIFHNLAYSAASPFTVSNNTITGLANANETSYWDGMLIASMTVASTVSGNAVDGSAITTIPEATGINVWNCQVAPAISGGSITGVGLGINVNNYEGYPNDPQAGNTFATISGLTISSASIAGIKIHDNPLNNKGSRVSAEISNVTVSTAPTGIWVTGPDASANIHDNTISASAAGINVDGTVTSSTSGLTISNNQVTLTSQLAGSTPTIGVALSNVSGTAAATVSGNTVANSFYGYTVYNLNTDPVTTITGGTVTGVMQGVSAFNTNGVVPAPSTFGVGSVTMSGFAGNHTTMPNINFHAGVYVFTGGSDAANVITATIDKVSVTGTGKIQQDCAGLSFADFSSGSGVRQDITVTECTITDNLNRGINIRGANADVEVLTSTLSGNGSDAFGAGGNDGFGIVAFAGAKATVKNNYITNPAASATAVTALFTFEYSGLGGTMEAHENSLSLGGNLASILAGNAGGTMNATCNWWGTTGPIPPLVNGAVTWKPFLNSGTSVGTPGFIPAAGTCVECIDMTLGDTHVDVSCFGGSNGSIDLTVTGGVAPFTYVWTPALGGVIPAGQEDDEDLTGLTPGTYSVVVTDGNLCTQTISVEITVSDVTAPVISTCPPAATINGCTTADISPAYSTDLLVTDAATYTAAGGVATDNCAITYYAYQDAAATGSCPITVVRTWTLKDGMNNESTCTQTIKVQDVTAPDLTVPADVTVNCQDSKDPLINPALGSATANDVCSGTVTPTYNDAAGQMIPSTFPGGTTVQGRARWGATGFEAALFDGPTNQAPGAQLNPSGTPAWVVNTAYAFEYGYIASSGTQTLKIDFNNNTVFETSEIINLTTAAYVGKGFKHFSIYLNGASGSNNAGLTLGNFVVNGTNLGSFTTPAGGSAIDLDWENSNGYWGDLTATGTLMFTGTTGFGSETPRVWFRFAVPVTTPEPPAVTCAGNYVINRVWTATDACGNKSIKVQKITVQDVTPPDITCPAAVEVHANSGCYFVGAITPAATATDNCSSVINIVNDIPVEGLPLGINTVTWTATDECGNYSTCTQTVTVVANTISGTLVYNNTAKTPMNKVKLILKDSDGNQVGGEVTTAESTGAFTFPNLCAGTYTIHVTFNDKDAGGINATDAAQVNAWSAYFGAIEHVKFLAGDVTFNKFIDSGDALKIQGYFVFPGNINYAITPKWSYWKKGETITDNFDSDRLLTDITVTITGDLLNLELYGMLTGDFDGSLVPTTLKSADPSLVLAENSNLQVGANQAVRTAVACCLGNAGGRCFHDS
jgi:hypothetical protein